MLYKAFYRSCGACNAFLQPHSLYAIKKGYHHASSAENFDAVNASEEWQQEVYELGVDAMASLKGSTVIDVGCGSGFKLLRYFRSFHTMGIEVEPTVTWLRHKYPDREWLEFGAADPAALSADLVICADVIEHLRDPGILMDFFRRIRFRTLVLSTPEREAVAGRSDFGPPENTSHFREWSAGEFAAYVSEYFEIKEQRIFPGKSTTQVVICSPKNSFS